MKYEVPFSRFRIRFAFLAHVRRACAFLFLLGFSQIAGFSRITWRLLWFKPAPMRLFDIGGIKSMQASVASVHIVEHPRLAHRAHFHLVGPFRSLRAAEATSPTRSPSENQVPHSAKRSIVATARGHRRRLIGPTARYDSSTTPQRSTNAMSSFRTMPTVCTSLHGMRIKGSLHLRRKSSPRALDGPSVATMSCDQARSLDLNPRLSRTVRPRLRPPPQARTTPSPTGTRPLPSRRPSTPRCPFPTRPNPYA